MRTLKTLAALAVSLASLLPASFAGAVETPTIVQPDAQLKTVINPDTTYPYVLTRPETVVIPPYKFNPPDPRRETLPNGLVVYLLEDPDLPTFQATAYTKVGSIYVPQEKAGLAQLTGTVMRTGGTVKSTGDELDRTLEFVGASVESGIDQEAGMVSATSLAKDSDLALQTMADILRSPRFSEDKLELAKNQMAEGIRRQNDDPEEIAQREFMRLVYGKDSPWAQVPTLESLAKIQRSDLMSFHEKYFKPNNTVLAVSGDFKSSEMLEKIRRILGDWKREPVQFPVIPKLSDVEKRQVYVVSRDIPQTVIWMGHLGYRRDPMLKPSVDVMNEIFGMSGFTSRITREVRTNQGLAYSAYGALTPRPDRGIFYAVAQTKKESAVRAAQLMDRVVREMTSKPVTEDEVQRATEAILNSYVFKYDSPFEIVSEMAYFDMLGYPKDYLTTYPEMVRKVTPAQVRQVAEQYLHPDKMVVLIVGDTEGVLPNVSELGPVTPLQIETIPDAVQPNPIKRD